MRGTGTIYRREVAGLFQAPIGWLLLLLALFVNGLVLYTLLETTRGDVRVSLAGVLGGGTPFWGFLCFLPPLLAMRMLAEESRSGTLEFLLTAPVSDAAVVLGKFLAATTFLAILWSSALLYGCAFQWGGAGPEWPALLATYLGAVLASGLFVAIAMLSSTLTRVPLLAAFLAFVACFTWLALPLMAEAALGLARTFLSVLPGVEPAQLEVWVAGALRRMDVVHHMQVSFLFGVVDTSEVVFFLTWTGMFLFFTVRSLEARRWRG